MSELLIFGGTREGRLLLERLRPALPAWRITVCVATEYGEEMLKDAGRGITVRSGRMGKEEMLSLLRRNRFSCVADATHPYALEVSRNIREACAETGTPCLRILRPSGAREGMILTESHLEAVSFLNHPRRLEEKALLTVGSKELAAYTGVKNRENRLFVRVLPSPEALETCRALGFESRRLIAMQGPFSAELNRAMLRHTGARYLVTKDSGAEGGLPEKAEAAEAAGAALILIGRKEEEKGLSFEEAAARLETLCGVGSGASGTAFRSSPERPAARDARDAGPRYSEPGQEEDRGSGELRGEEKGRGPGAPCGRAETREEKKTRGPGKQTGPEEKAGWFPLFTDISEKQILIVGAGRIACRRIGTLSRFRCRIRVVAPAVLPELEEKIRAARDSRKPEPLLLEKRPYVPEDLDGADLVLTATGKEEVDGAVFRQCRARGIPVNVAGDRNRCDFYFPGLIRAGGVTVGVAAEGKDHRKAKETTRKIRQWLEEEENRE